MKPLTNELQMMNGTDIFGDLPGRTNENKQCLSVTSHRADIRKLDIESVNQACLCWFTMCDVCNIYKAWCSQTSEETNCGIPSYGTPWSCNWVAEFWRHMLAFLLSSVNSLVSFVLAVWTKRCRFSEATIMLLTTVNKKSDLINEIPVDPC
jgi:hypothetical protein